MNAEIVQGSSGGYSIYPPNSPRAIGNYATEADALRACYRNGWEVDGWEISEYKVGTLGIRWGVAAVLTLSGIVLATAAIFILIGMSLSYSVRAF